MHRVVVRFLQGWNEHLIDNITDFYLLQGGSNFAAYYNYEDLIKSPCTTIELQADKSNYWMVGFGSYPFSNSNG
jgi:hypothetical protein